MNFPKDPRTNWKYILIVVVLAVIVGGGILWWATKQEVPTIQLPEVKKSEKITEEKCKAIQDLGKQAKCYTDLAKETKDESYCGKIEIPEMPEIRADCYAWLAFLKNDPSICEKVETASLKSSCLNYFKEKSETADWKTYRNEKYGYEIKYPLGFDVFAKDAKDEKGELLHLFTTLPYSGENEHLNYCQYSVRIGSEEKIGTIEKFVEDWKKDSVWGKPSIASITIDSREGTKAAWKKEGFAASMAVVENQGKIYSIEFVAIPPMNAVGSHKLAILNKCSSVFNQMLSTFRFLE